MSSGREISWDIVGMSWKQYLKRTIQSDDPENVAEVKRLVQLYIRDNGSFANLFESGYKIDVMNDNQQTAIHVAFHQHITNFWELRPFSQVKNGINFVDRFGLSHFHISCTLEDSSVVKNFIEKGEDVNHRCHLISTYENYTPLLFATRFERSENVKLLLDNGADITVVAASGLSSLHFACRPIRKSDISLAFICEYMSRAVDEGLKIVQFLCERGCEIDVKDHSGDTPLMHVLDDQYYEALLEFVYRSYDFPNDSPSYEEIVTHIRRVQLLKLQTLLDHKADVTTVGDNGDMALHRAIENLKSTRCPQNYFRMLFEDTLSANAVDLLLKNGADVDALNGREETPLLIAVSLLSADIVRVLLENDADINSLTFHHNWNFFHYPTVLPCLEAIENLLEITKLLSEKGRILTLMENLVIMRFFIYNVDYSIVRNDMESEYKFSNILHYGTEATIERILSQGYNAALMKQISVYLTDVITSGFYLNKEIGGKLRTYAKYEPIVTSTDRIKEVNLTKTIQVHNGVSLYRILTMHPNRVYPYLKKRSGILKMTVDKGSFRYLSLMIKGHIAKATIRQYVLESAIDYLRLYIPINLPDHCCENILVYLTNEEIWNICSMAMEIYENED